MTVIVGLQYLSPIMGLALLVAMLRALFLQSVNGRFRSKQMESY
jgi:K+-transporting ATPase ATPase A chain